MFGSRVAFSGSADQMVQLFEFQKSKVEACGHLGYTKMAITSHRFADRRDVWF